MNTYINMRIFLLLFQIEIDAAISNANGEAEFRGTAVSLGVAEGVARVITDFDSEAHLIRKGEILVTHATDTGIIRH